MTEYDKVRNTNLMGLYDKSTSPKKDAPAVLGRIDEAKPQQFNIIVTDVDENVK